MEGECLKRIAIIGSSGVGKKTLIQALQQYNKSCIFENVAPKEDIKQTILECDEFLTAGDIEAKELRIPPYYKQQSFETPKFYGKFIKRKRTRK